MQFRASTGQTRRAGRHDGSAAGVDVVPVLRAARNRIRAGDGRAPSLLRRTALAAIVGAFIVDLLVHPRDARSEEPTIPGLQAPRTPGQDAYSSMRTPAGGPDGHEASDTRTPPAGTAPGHVGEYGLRAPVRAQSGTRVTTADSSPPASVGRRAMPHGDENGTDHMTDGIAAAPTQEPLEPAGVPAGRLAGPDASDPVNAGRLGGLLWQLLDEAAPSGGGLAKTVPVSRTASPDEPIRPIAEETSTNPEKVALGRALFHDPRLSKDNTTACVTCHDLGSGGDDGRRVSVGVEGRTGPINAPTVFNVLLNFKQFWDGRASTLHEQIDGPVQSTVELGSLWPDVVAKLYDHESYPARFDALYAEGITRETVKDALVEFMRSLTTPNSRFDQWLNGDEDAIDDQEKYGYALFKHYGCVSCHQGANVGGNMFQVFGVINAYFDKRGNVTDADLGRFNVTGDAADRHAFKVPSLRMALHTAPYLHDGHAATLRDAVDAMFEFQLGREAPDEDKEAIVAFIRTLAGENRELFQ